MFLALTLWALSPSSNAWLMLVWVVLSAADGLPLRPAVVVAGITFLLFLVVGTRVTADLAGFRGSVPGISLLMAAIFIIGAQRRARPKQSSYGNLLT